MGLPEDWLLALKMDAAAAIQIPVKAWTNACAFMLKNRPLLRSESTEPRVVICTQLCIHAFPAQK
jgi:hypothetical protein